MSAKVVRTTVSRRYDRFGQSTPAKTGVEFWLPASSWPAKTDVVLLPATDFDAMVELEREARETIERIEGMAVRPHCLCGRPTGTAAIQACARAFLAETKGET
jgi:hypothetical protein